MLLLSGILSLFTSYLSLHSVTLVPFSLVLAVIILVHPNLDLKLSCGGGHMLGQTI